MSQMALFVFDRQNAWRRVNSPLSREMKKLPVFLFMIYLFANEDDEVRINRFFLKLVRFLV
jgi:hypothetical protein